MAVKFRLDVCCFQLFRRVPIYSFDSGADALEAAITAVSKYGGASAGYRTLLDALIPALPALKEVNITFFHDTSLTFFSCIPYSLRNFMHWDQRLNAGDDPVDAFVISAEAASAGAESTKHMQAQVLSLYLLLMR